MLLNAYAQGVFPMSEDEDDPEIFWVDPKRRGIFPMGGFHISRSLRRAILKQDYTVSIDQDFIGVLEGCADRDRTWINETIKALYIELFELGHAHSLEIWRDGTLIGGVYGVTLGTAFFGESMFSRATNASKIALAYLHHRLICSGFTLFDTQFITPHLASLGAIEIPRALYKHQLSRAIFDENPAHFDMPAYRASAYEVVQRSTQTS